MYVRWTGPAETKTINRRGKDFLFPKGEWVFVPDLLLYKEIRDNFQGTVFDVQEYNISGLEKIRKRVVIMDDGLIMTADSFAIGILLDSVDFVKLQAVKRHNHIFKILDWFHEGYSTLSGNDVTTILAYRSLGGWGDVQMVLSALDAAKEASPGYDYLFSAPGPYHTLAENNPNLRSMRPFHRFRELKERADVLLDLTRPCIRYEIHNQPNVDRNRIETFAEELRVKGDFKYLSGYYFGKDELKANKSPRDKPLIGLCIRSNAAVRNWSDTNWAVLANRLKDWGAEILIIHNTRIHELDDHETVAGSELREVVRRMNDCDLLVGMDTGPMHTAAVLRIPTLWLFTHIDGKIRAKNYPDAEIIQHPESCSHSPCWYSIKCGNEKIRDPECSKAITVDEVFSKATNMLERPFLSWVVVGHNKLHFTQKCIDHIRWVKKWSHEIIFVDNGSSDNTPSWIKAQPDIEYFRMDSNLGCVLGRDFGIRQVKGKYVVTLDNDQFIGLRFLNQLFNVRADVVGVEAWSMKRSGYAFRIEVAKKPLYYVGGGGCLFTKDAAMRIEYLDKNFAPAWFSDVDFCRKMVKAGFKLGHARNADVVHLGHRTVFSQTDFNHKEAWRKSHQYFLKKWRRDLQFHGY